MADGSVRQELEAAGAELVARAMELRDKLAAAGDLAGEALDDIKARLQQLATDMDALIDDVDEETDDGDDGDVPGDATPDAQPG